MYRPAQKRYNRRICLWTTKNVRDLYETTVHPAACEQSRRYHNWIRAYGNFWIHSAHRAHQPDHERIEDGRHLLEKYQVTEKALYQSRWPYILPDFSRQHIMTRFSVRRGEGAGNIAPQPYIPWNRTWGRRTFRFPGCAGLCKGIQAILRRSWRGFCGNIIKMLIF